MRGDIRSGPELESALDGVDGVVLLAALVGDPICRQYPDAAREINVGGATNVLDACAAAGVERLVFASTCSNYGLRESGDPANEEDELKPLSIYAETKVEMEAEILSRSEPEATVLRVATAYGISPRMRFDLTVSEFTRELALGRELEVYDADTWRPYCHVADISDAILRVFEAPSELVASEVFNAGGEEGNYTKRKIAEAAAAAVDGRGSLKWVEGGVDPRNYRVSFDKIADRLGFAPRMTVPSAIESLAAAIDAGVFADVEERPEYFGNRRLVDVAPAPTAEGAQ